MKSAVPKVSQTARLLLHNSDAVTGCSSSSSIAGSLRGRVQQYTFSTTSMAAAAAKAPPPGRAPSAAAKPDNQLPEVTASAAKAMADPAPTEAPPDSSSSSSGAGGNSNGDGKKGSNWLTTAALLALPAGTYYYYQHQKNQYMQEQDPTQVPQRQSLMMPDLSSLVKGSKDFVGNIKNNIPDMAQVRDMVTGSGKKADRSDKLTAQKQRDEDSGFKILPPDNVEAAASTVAAADDTAAAAAAARDSLTAAADEFPGSTDGAAAAATTGPAAGSKETPTTQHVDIAPINALFSEVSNIDPSGATASSSSSSKVPSSSKSSSGKATAEDASRITTSLAAVAAANQEQQQQQSSATPAPTAPAAAAAPMEYHSDSELGQICRKLGVSVDVTPSGLIAAANAAGLGSISSSTGTALPAQMAQLNQASADARLLGSLLQQLAAAQDSLQQQLTAAEKEKQWAEEAAKKREESLAAHFKELLREQQRLNEQVTARAVREAEEVLLAEVTTAHLEERQQRLAAVDDLRGRVNALAVAFDQRTSQVRSAHEVNKISLGVLALSKALEGGTPIAQQLKDLAVGCPNDPVVEAVAASLPASAASEGLPTLQQLQQQFSTVARQASEAVYFSAEVDGGVLARLLAKAAVALKVDAGTAAEGSDRQIQLARELLQQGKLLAAADTLAAAAAGTQAALVVQQWVAAARARAVADQAVRLLQAHATSTALAAQG